MLKLCLYGRYTMNNRWDWIDTLFLIGTILIIAVLLVGCVSVFLAGARGCEEGYVFDPRIVACVKGYRP